VVVVAFALVARFVGCDEGSSCAECCEPSFGCCDEAGVDDGVGPSRGQYGASSRKRPSLIESLSHSVPTILSCEPFSIAFNAAVTFFSCDARTSSSSVSCAAQSTKASAATRTVLEPRVGRTMR